MGQGRTARHPCLARDSNPGPLVQQPASLTTSPPVDQLKIGTVAENTVNLRMNNPFISLMLCFFREHKKMGIHITSEAI